MHVHACTLAPSEFIKDKIAFELLSILLWQLAGEGPHPWRQGVVVDGGGGGAVVPGGRRGADVTGVDGLVVGSGAGVGVSLGGDLVVLGVEVLGVGAVKVEPPVADEVVLVEDGT